jgi:hypothetical protein
MAEIKSTLEIALARAKSLGDGVDKVREEGRKRGRALARQVVDGVIPADDLVGSLAGLSAEEHPHAYKAAAEALLQAVEDGRPLAVSGLAAMAQGTPAEQAAQSLVELADKTAEADERFREELTALLKQRFASMGISGSAVRPNPEAGTELDSLLEDFKNKMRQERQDHLDFMRQALVG